MKINYKLSLQTKEELSKLKSGEFEDSLYNLFGITELELDGKDCFDNKGAITDSPDWPPLFAHDLVYAIAFLKEGEQSFDIEETANRLSLQLQPNHLVCVTFLRPAITEKGELGEFEEFARECLPYPALVNRVKNATQSLLNEITEINPSLAADSAIMKLRALLGDL